MKTIGQRLAHARDLAELPASELGELAGLSKSIVAMIESGARGTRPSGSTVVKLAETLGVPAGWLLDGEGPEPAKADVMAAIATARAKPPASTRTTPDDGERGAA